MKIYVSGPMTGLPELNFPAFHAAAAALRAAGHVVVNPAELNPEPGKSWAACLRRDLAALVECDAVATLDGWESSKGARLEVHVAQVLDMPTAPLACWLEPVNPDYDISFNERMLAEVLAGRKTQTRRPVKWRGLDPGLNLSFSGLRAVKVQGGWVLESDTRTSDEWRSKPTPCPYGAPGMMSVTKDGSVPGLASVALRVVSVRVERLQSMTGDDAIAEGCRGGHGSIPGYPYAATPLEHFHGVYNGIYGAGSWESNPWVWVIEFEPVPVAEHAS